MLSEQIFERNFPDFGISGSMQDFRLMRKDSRLQFEESD